jgi:hypothetical protein
METMSLTFKTDNHETRFSLVDDIKHFASNQREAEVTRYTNKLNNEFISTPKPCQNKSDTSPKAFLYQKDTLSYRLMSKEYSESNVVVERLTLLLSFREVPL